MQNKYKYTKNWFLISEIKDKIINFIDINKKNDILEIGCYEGLSSVYFGDNLLLNENSTLTLIDPFLTISDNDHKELLLNNVEDNFDYNISICNNNKITVYKIKSDDFYAFNVKYYDFIYVDGSHIPEQINKDIKNSFKFLNHGGILWIDDYLGGNGDEEIKKTIDLFLSKIYDEYILIHKGYQIGIKKI